jgi:hypothetical protein
MEFRQVTRIQHSRDVLLIHSRHMTLTIMFLTNVHLLIFFFNTFMACSRNDIKVLTCQQVVIMTASYTLRLHHASQDVIPQISVAFYLLVTTVNSHRKLFVKIFTVLFQNNKYAEQKEILRCLSYALQTYTISPKHFSEHLKYKEPLTLKIAKAGP